MNTASQYLSALLLAACFVQPASAQFEGELTYKAYEFDRQGNEKGEDEFTLYITPERILLQGEKSYKFMGEMQTEGVLARLDHQDFVILTGDSEALQISKDDITAMMNMFGGGNNISNAAEKADEISYQRTGERKTIAGYEAEKFIFEDEESPNAYTAVWMTQEVNINWGMLAEPWSGSAQEIMSSGLPVDLIFKEKFFPLQAESYEGDRLTSRLVATTINESPVAQAMVQIPSGVQVLNFQDYLFQKMSRQ